MRLFPVVVTSVVSWASPAASDCYNECLNRHGCDNERGQKCGIIAGQCSRWECHASQSKWYGAIAVTSQGKLSYGFAFNFSTREAAEQAAVQRCNDDAGSETCTATTWFYNSCAALAVGADDAWGADHAASPAQAEASALDACKQQASDGQCHVVKAFCSPS